MTKLILAIGLITLAGCASSKTGTTSKKSAPGDTRTREIQFLDENTYLLTEVTDDKSYGYTESNPVKVGGANESSGPKNERRFLNGYWDQTVKKLNIRELEVVALSRHQMGFLGTQECWTDIRLPGQALQTHLTFLSICTTRAT